MKNLIALIAGTSLAALAGGSAVAADIPVKTPQVEVYSWTGGYVGVGVGAKWSRADWTTTCLNGLGVLPPVAGACGTPLNAVLFPIDATSPHRFNNTGVRGTFYTGFNIQASQNVVVGAEVDIAWSNNNQSFLGIVGCSGLAGCGLPPLPGNVDRTTVSVRGDASLRGRLGFLVTPDWLVYGTGGIAFQEINAVVTCSSAGAFCISPLPSTSNNLAVLVGATAGAGLEYKWGHYVLRGEYRYSQFKTQPLLLFSEASGQAIHANLNLHTHIATVGISYLFNSAPVAAKY